MGLFCFIFLVFHMIVSHVLFSSFSSFSLFLSPKSLVFRIFFLFFLFFFHSFLCFFFSFLSFLIRFPVRKSTSPVLSSFPVLCAYFAFSLIGSWHRFDDLCGYPIIHNSLLSLCLFFLVGRSGMHNSRMFGSHLHSDFSFRDCQEKIIASW